MENTSTRFYGLDHLRALAILLVLMFHYRSFSHPSWIDNYGRFGWTGVDLFFVLSGFLISNQLFKEIKRDNKVHLRNFYIKRFFRIIPPYLFVLGLYFAFPFFREREALPPLWKFITFSQNLGLDVIHHGAFSHAWSLCIEEQFYLLLPLFLLFSLKVKVLNKLVVIVLFLILVSIVARFIRWEEVININTKNFWQEWYMKIYYPTYTRIDGLSIGVLIGYLYQYSTQFNSFIRSRGNQLFILGLLLLALSFWFCIDPASEKASIFGFTFVSFSFGLLVVAAISGTSLLSQKKSFITSQLASLSYAIYLSHKGVIHMIQAGLNHLHFRTSGNMALIIALVFCILTGLLFKYIIEKPSFKLRNQLLNK